MALKLSWKLFCVSLQHFFMALKSFQGILNVGKEIQIYTMNF